MLFKAGFGDRGRCAALASFLVCGFGALVPSSALAAGSINLAWAPSADTNIASYNVYYGVASGTYTNMLSAGNATNATISGLTDGVTYYFAATALDASGLESAYSNEVSNTPAAGTNQITVLSTAPTLTIVQSGQGKVSSSFTGQNLKVGRTYTVTAVPAPGQIFAGWSGSVTSSTPRVSFVMTSNIVLDVCFVPLTLTISGTGTLSPNLLLSQSLIAGHAYTVTAVPGSGQLFASWSGSVTSSTPKLSFTLTTNTVLQANFIPNPYLAVQGAYNGLFYEEDGVRPDSAGAFTVSVTTRGSYSGKLQLGTNHLAFNGQLNFQCQATNVLQLNASNTLTLQLSVGGANQPDQISGYLTDGSWVSSLSGDRAVFNSRTNPAPYAGNYTLIIPGQNGDPSLPVGDGFGTVQVNSNGLATFSGTLADGTAVSQSATLSQQGLWPLYIALYSGQGSLLSWLAFTNQPGNDFNGLLSWIKPANPAATYYPAGFTNQCLAIGSAYLKPATSGSNVLNLTNAGVVFSGGNLAADFTNSVVFGPSSQITNLSSNPLTLTFSLSAGTFKGSVTDPATGNSLPFSGAVFQKQSAAYGFLLGTNLSSQVLITP
jgi:hypothetical protein